MRLRLSQPNWIGVGACAELGEILNNILEILKRYHTFSSLSQNPFWLIFLKSSSSPTHSCHFMYRDVKMHVTLEQQQILLTFLNRQSWTMNRFSVCITILRILKIKSNKKRCHLLFWYALRIFRIVNIHCYILKSYRSNFQILFFMCSMCLSSSTQ